MNQENLNPNQSNYSTDNYQPLAERPGSSKTLIMVLTVVIILLVLLSAGLAWALLTADDSEEMAELEERLAEKEGELEEVGEKEEPAERSQRAGVDQTSTEKESIIIDRSTSPRTEEVSFIFRYPQVEDITTGDREGPWQIKDWNFEEGQEPKRGLDSYESSLAVTFEGEAELRGVLEYVEMGYGIEDEVFFKPDNDSILQLPELRIQGDSYVDETVISGMTGQDRILFSDPDDKEKLKELILDKPNEQLAADLIISSYSISRWVRDYGRGFPATARLKEVVETHPQWEEK